MGLGADKYFIELLEKALSYQTVTGYFLNDFSGCLRLLVLIDNYPEARRKALQYFLENWSDLEPDEIAKGMLALQELDFWLYEERLQEMAKFLSDSQQVNGSIGGRDAQLYEFEDTCIAIVALSRMKAWREVALKAAEYVKHSQRPNGSWGRTWDDGTSDNRTDDASLAILALNAIGEGPKTALCQVEWDNILAKQRERFLKPYFVHTSPLYGKSLHVKQIHDRVIDMVNNAKGAIRICSLYWDMLYENIVERVVQGSIECKIIVRPRADIRGVREKINKNVLDILNVCTKGNVRTNPVVHTRLLIIDDKEVLISTADLTRDQLFDEYNAGIWTRDQEVVQQAIEFFENLWNESDKLS